MRNAIVEFSFYETAFVHEISVINEPAMLGTIINSLFKSPTVLFWHNINISISKISFYISFFNETNFFSKPVKRGYAPKN